MDSFVLLDRVGVEVLPASLANERYAYMPQARTLFVDSSLPLDELFAICEDVLAEVMQAWEPISELPPTV